MTVHDLGPYWIEIYSHSVDAPHVMTLPLKGWSAGVDAGDLTKVGGGTVPALTAIQDFVDLLKPFYPTTYTFDYFFIYEKLTPTSVAIPAAGGQLTGNGDQLTPGWSRATQATFLFKTALGGLMKIVLLDFASNNNFAPINFAGLTGDALAFVNYMLGADCVFVGRDGADPQFFLKIAYKLNDELRKQYHLD